MWLCIAAPLKHLWVNTAPRICRLLVLKVALSVRCMPVQRHLQRLPLPNQRSRTTPHCTRGRSLNKRVSEPSSHKARLARLPIGAWRHCRRTRHLDACKVLLTTRVYVVSSRHDGGHNLLNHRRVCKGGNITNTVVLRLSDLTQNTAHNLSGSSFWES